MPVWLLQALMALRAAGVPGRALALGGGFGAATIGPGLVSGLIPDFGPFRAGGGADGRPPRKRRKRLLTHQMKDDLAFIAATMGETTARKAALIAITH